MEEEQKCLEDYIHGFLNLWGLTNFPDHSLCAFLYDGFNDGTKAHIPDAGPQGSARPVSKTCI